MHAWPPKGAPLTLLLKPKMLVRLQEAVTAHLRGTKTAANFERDQTNPIGRKLHQVTLPLCKLVYSGISSVIE